jgi:hypothetical protein
MSTTTFTTGSATNVREHPSRNRQPINRLTYDRQSIPTRKTERSRSKNTKKIGNIVSSNTHQNTFSETVQEQSKSEFDYAFQFFLLNPYLYQLKESSDMTPIQNETTNGQDSKKEKKEENLTGTKSALKVTDVSETEDELEPNWLNLMFEEIEMTRFSSTSESTNSDDFHHNTDEFLMDPYQDDTMSSDTSCPLMEALLPSSSYLRVTPSITTKVEDVDYREELMRLLGITDEEME